MTRAGHRADTELLCACTHWDSICTKFAIASQQVCSTCLTSVLVLWRPLTIEVNALASSSAYSLDGAITVQKADSNKDQPALHERLGHPPGTILLVPGYRSTPAIFTNTSLVDSPHTIEGGDCCSPHTGSTSCTVEINTVVCCSINFWQVLND